jgi:hypothetical protein
MKRTIRTSSRAAGFAGALLVSPALAQLQPSEVLVVYDSRIADSRTVAEYYAGSALVPGGVGGLPGTRRGVLVFDLASAGQPAPNTGTITYDNFIARIRNPLRNHLTASGRVRQVRSIVLTKGFPHRIDDTNNPGVGDRPSQQGAEYQAGDATSASVDSELTLLWQDLSTTVVSGRALQNGAVLSPYYRGTRPVGLFSIANVARAKSFIVSGNPGQLWQADPNAPAAERLAQGDFYLVCRLDARTVADVRGMLDRARSIRIDVNNIALVLDESNSNGIADASANDELDNTAGTTRFGDDYELTRDRALTTDKRLAPANVFYNKDAGAGEFFVGPRLAWSGAVRLVSTPVILLGTYGANHAGQPQTTAGAFAGGVYADSFNYAPGAVFNTIESFNGRDFGGVGGFTGGNGIPQEQAADFIAAGGTFAIGYVWEPFTLGLAKNQNLLRNFILGSLTWAEAAYTSVPLLSWQSIVLGDPLARVVRSSEDIDADGQVTIDDVYAWQANPTDINRDGQANAADRDIILGVIRFFEPLQMSQGRR